MDGLKSAFCHYCADLVGDLGLWLVKPHGVLGSCPISVFAQLLHLADEAAYTLPRVIRGELISAVGANHSITLHGLEFLIRVDFATRY